MTEDSDPTAGLLDRLSGDAAHVRRAAFARLYSGGRVTVSQLATDCALAETKVEDALIPPPPRPGRRGRRIGKGDHGTRTCSFCGCTDPHRAMVTGPGIRICGECVTLSADILKTERDAHRDPTPGGRLPRLTPVSAAIRIARPRTDSPVARRREFLIAASWPWAVRSRERISASWRSLE